MKKLWHIIEKILGVYRWHPKIALRYLPIVTELKRRDLPDEAILEVGSGGLGIAPYLKRQVVGLDVNFSHPIHPGLVPVKGDATAIPFADNSFATVVSVDMLEHLKSDKRKHAIKEMLRVAEKFVAIGVPCGELAEKQDRELQKLYEATKKGRYRFFDEQVEYGLPTQEFITASLTEAANALKKQIHTETQGNINLSLRWFLMRGWISDNLLVNILFRKLMLLMIPFLRHLDQPPTYRELFFVTIK